MKQGICLFAVLIILHIFLSVHLCAADSDLYSKYIDNTETWVTDIVPAHSARLPGWADTLRSTPGGIIDIVTGQLVCAAGDIHIGMGVYGLEFSRFYSSGLAVNEIHGEVNDSYIGKIGTGWRTCLDYRLVRPQSLKKKGKARPSGYIFILPDGNKYYFQPVPGNKKGAAQGAYAMAGKPWKAYDSGGGVSVTAVNTVYLFDEQLRLAGMTDAAGRGVKISYGAGIVEAGDDFGRKLIINKDAAGLITSITSNIKDFQPYEFKYQRYNGRDYLVLADRPGAEDAEYGYYNGRGPEGYLNRQKDLRKKGKNKELIYTAGQDGDSGRYTGESNAGGDTLIKLVYNNRKTVTITDGQGQKKYMLNDGGRAGLVYSGGIAAAAITYDSAGEPVKIARNNGASTEYSYDNDGNIITAKTSWNDPVDKQRVMEESWGYDRDGRMFYYTDGELRTTKYDHDGLGRITTISKGTAGIHCTYNAMGLVDTVTDSEKMSKTYSYDIYGNLQKIRNNATGDEETFSFDALGKIQSRILENGTMEKFYYDGNFPSQFSSAVNGGNGTINYSYDKRGNIEYITDNQGTINYQYAGDTLGTVKDRAGGETVYRRDDYGRLLERSCNDSWHRLYNYDPDGRVITMIDSNNQPVTYSYDDTGGKVTVKDRNFNNNSTDYVYDGLGRVRAVTDANRNTTLVDYDRTGCLTLVIDGDRNSTQYDYDGNSRVIRRINGDGSCVTYEYSPEGDLLKRTVFNSSGARQKELDYKYDGAHRLIDDGFYRYNYGHYQGCSCPDKAESVTDVLGTMQYEYDYKGRLTKTIYQDNTCVEDVYDDRAGVKTVKLDGYEVFELQLDAEGRADKVIEKINRAYNTFLLTRDISGRLLGMIYPNGSGFSEQYDAEGRDVNFQAAGPAVSFDYSRPGYLDNEGNILYEGVAAGVNKYFYDQDYQLAEADYQQGQTFTWAYDGTGNRAYSSEPVPEWSGERGYDANQMNQYKRVRDKYDYDSDGNLLNSGKRFYTWDDMNRLSTATGENSKTEYIYDHENRKIALGYPQEIYRTFYYDGPILLAEKAGGAVQDIYINDGQEIIGAYGVTGTAKQAGRRTYFMFDAQGSVAAVTEEKGNSVQAYQYTPYGLQLNKENEPENNIQFAGKYGGYRDPGTGLIYLDKRWYDALDGRFIDRDPAGMQAGVNPYMFAGNNPKFMADEDVHGTGMELPVYDMDSFAAAGPGDNAGQETQADAIGRMAGLQDPGEQTREYDALLSENHSQAVELTGRAGALKKALAGKFNLPE